MNGRNGIRMAVWGLIAALLPSFLCAQTATRKIVLPYAAFLDYGGTQSKSHGFVSGLYGYYGHGRNHSVETDTAYLRIRYDAYGDEGPHDLNQLDMTFVYSNYSFPGWKLRGGIHGILTSDNLTNKAFVLFGGISRYKTYAYEAGVDVYTSVYSRHVPDALHVLQVTATGGYYFGEYYRYGSFFARTRANYIRLSDDVGFEETELGSIEQSLSYYRGGWTVKASAWFGRQLYGVQNDGFIVRNLSEVHRGAFGGSVEYAVTGAWTVKLDVSRGRFSEPDSQKDSSVYSYLVLLGYSF